jgi:RNA polymerase sigma factor (sigma-70 family)
LTEHKRLISAGSRVRLRLAADDRLVSFVRRGDTAAFEVLYERHSRGLLSFCAYMLGSRHDAEDAVQATFAAAYRALLADERPVALRPWLFTIARNDCMSILRKRRPTVELNGEPALGGDPVRELELREEVRHTFEGLRELPESQRAALVLAELHGLSQVEIGGVLGVEPEQVKAYVYQARSKLVSARRAREADCREIREELATARGGALLRGRLRRHVRSCEECRLYADGVARQRRQLAALLPLIPSLMLKHRVFEDALGLGGADPATYAGSATAAGALAGTAAEIAGGGVKALAIKVAAGVAVLGASAGVSASMIGVPTGTKEHTAAASLAAQTAPRALLASVDSKTHRTSSHSTLGEGGRGIGATPNGAEGASPSASSIQQSSPGPGGGSGQTGLNAPEATRTTPGTSGEGQSPDAGGPAPATVAPRSESEETRQKERREDEQQARENHKQSEEREQQTLERKQQREAREQRRQERKQTREEGSSVGESRPPKTEEEPPKEHEESPTVGRSRPPRTEEELRKKREKREQRRKERLEQRARERKEAEESAAVS